MSSSVKTRRARRTNASNRSKDHNHHVTHQSPAKYNDDDDDTQTTPHMQKTREDAWVNAVRAPDRLRFVPHTVLVEQDVVIKVPVQEAIERAFAEAHIRDEFHIVDNNNNLIDFNNMIPSWPLNRSETFEVENAGASSSLMMGNSALNSQEGLMSALRHDQNAVGAQVPHGADATATDRILGAKTYIPYTIRVRQKVTPPPSLPGDTTIWKASTGPRQALHYVQSTSSTTSKDEINNENTSPHRQQHSLAVAMARLMYAYEQAPGGPAHLLYNATSNRKNVMIATSNDHRKRHSNNRQPSGTTQEIFHGYVRQLLPILLPARFARLPMWQKQYDNSNDDFKLANDVAISALSFDHFHKLLAKQELAQRAKRAHKVKARCVRCGTATYIRTIPNDNATFIVGNQPEAVCASCVKRSSNSSGNTSSMGVKKAAAAVFASPTPVNPVTATYADYFGHDPTSGSVQNKLGIIPNDGHPDLRVCFPFHAGFVFGVVAPLWTTRWTENVNLVIVPNVGVTLDQVAQQFGFLANIPLMGIAVVICNGGADGILATQYLNGIYLFAGLVNTDVQVGPVVVPTTCFLLRPARFGPRGLVPIVSDNVVIQLGACEGMWVIDALDDQTRPALDCSAPALTWLVHRSVWRPPVFTTLMRQTCFLAHRLCGACRRPFTHCTCSQQDAARHIRLLANGNMATSSTTVGLSTQHGAHILPQAMMNDALIWPSPWVRVESLIDKKEEKTAESGGVLLPHTSS